MYACVCVRKSLSVCLCVAFDFTSALFCLHLFCKAICAAYYLYEKCYYWCQIDWHEADFQFVQWVVLWIWHSTDAHMCSGWNPLHVWPIRCRWERVCWSYKDLLHCGECICIQMLYMHVHVGGGASSLKSSRGLCGAILTLKRPRP